MTLVQVTEPDQRPADEEEEGHCICCLNRIRVAALKRRRHAAWMARGARRRGESSE